VEPEQLIFTPEMNPVESCMHSGQIVDTIRHLYLGKQPLLVKQCTRYGRLVDQFDRSIRNNNE